jgi:hypothetical protein
MGARISTLRGYFQNHHVPCDELPHCQNTYEAIAEVWIDNLHDLFNFRDEPLIKKYILDDEKNFIDVERMKFLVAREDILVSGPDLRYATDPGLMMWSLNSRPTSIKVMHFSRESRIGKREREIALSESLNAVRHVISHPAEDYHQGNSDYAFCREVWWPTLTDFNSAIRESRPAFDELFDIQDGDFAILVQSERWNLYS